ncbi:MAG: substrate-binding domain-containing protein [bacterium]
MANSPLIGSKYQQVQSLLVQRIQSGQIKRGQCIPSEPQLCEQLGVSRETVRRAVGNLVRDGMLETRPGYGHVVCSLQPRRTVAVLLNRDLFTPAPTPFIPLVLRAVREELQRRGCRMLLHGPSAGAYSALEGDYSRLERDIRRRAFAGLLGLAWPHSPDAEPEAAVVDQRVCEALTAKKIPYAMLSDYPLEASTGTDYHAIGYLGTRHFLEQGLNRVGLLIGQPSSGDLVWEEVLRGYKAALTEARLAIRDDWVLRLPSEAALGEQSGYEAFRAWWRGTDQPQAMVVGDDTLAKGAMVAAVEAGVRIPEQLQFASLAIKGGCTFFPRPFVRLEMDPAAYARHVVDQLLMMLDSDDATPAGVRVRPRVVPAESAHLHP